MHSALFLLLTLVSIAVLYLQQHAALVAAIQIVVYASAIVVLFLFVITLLGCRQARGRSTTRTRPTGRGDRPRRARPHRDPRARARQPLGHRTCTRRAACSGTGDDSGNVKTLATSLFTDFVWAFEITAVLLVIAVVGSVVLARRSGHRPEADSAPDPTGAASEPNPSERTSA